MSTQVTLITSEGVRIEKDKKIISQLFKFFEDYFEEFPNASEVTILSLEEWSYIDSFTTLLLIPDNKDDWLKIITTAEFLCLIPRYSEVLRKEARKFTLKQGAKIVDSKKITLVDLDKKILDPTYLLPSERCQWVTPFNQYVGERCEAPVVLNEKYCASCIKKKPYTSHLIMKICPSAEPELKEPMM